MELSTKKTICLNMIVKDESHVITDTLHNLWSYIQFDTYVVSDTGSSDNTKALIKTFFDEKGVSGLITDDAWKDFGHNRTMAFNHAYNKSDYVFVWDADDRIKGSFKLPNPLTADSYSFSFGSYSRRQLFNNRKKWKYVGVLHECPTCCEQEGREEKVVGAYHFESNRTGARNKDPLKYLKDGQILEKAFYEALEAKDSLHMRYAYYCANSYNSTSTHKDKAIEFYKKVLTLDNWHQEKYNSCIELFQIHEQQGKTQEALHWLVESHKYDKTRIEGVFRLIRYYCSIQSEVAFAYYTLIQDYVENKYLTDNIAIKLFVKNSEYEFYLPYYMIIVADRVKQKEVGGKMYEILFQKGHVPGEWWTKNVFTNIQFFLEHLPKTPEFFLSMTNYFDTCRKAGHTFTGDHYRILDKVLAKSKPILGSLSPLDENRVRGLKGIGNRGNLERVRVMFTITTCKRLDLFQKTMSSILKCWTDLEQVDYFYCVDDNSSEEDREVMRQSFPFFDYLMKGAEQRGHMKSMNLIWNKLQEVKPTYWIHMEDDWLFFKQEAYVSRAIKVLDSYKTENVHQVVFNKNYGLMMDDMERTGGKMLDPATRLHIKIDQQPGRNAGFWPHYSLQPSMCRTETILGLGDYTTKNKFFERDYANKYFAKGYQTAFFEGIYSLHIGKQHWETEGQNAYALNAESQFNWQGEQPARTSLISQQSNQSEQPAIGCGLATTREHAPASKKNDMNSNLVIQPEPESNPIVEQKESEQKQEWLPITYPQFHGTMTEHLEQLKGLIVQEIPFALIRPSDGEYSVIKGQTLTNCDRWTFQAGGKLQTDLTEAVQTDASGLYVGIPCNTCNKPWNCTQKIYDDYRTLLRTQNITYANIFMNANWPAFVSMLKEDKRPLYVITSGTTGTTELQIRGRHIIDPLLVNKWDEEGLKETTKILDFVRTKNNALFCFSAGPLSKVWIPKCWAINPTNTYLDVGAALDPFTKGAEVKSRFYTDRGHPFAKEVCQFRERQVIELSSKKNLVYMCVFHNKNYLKLLELLLTSMKVFSRTENFSFDILVMTSPDFEKEVQDLSELIQIPLRTHLCDFKTLHESSCARLYIHDYPEIDSYGKILYIDTDIIVQNDLTALLSEPLEDKVYALIEGTIEHEFHGGWYFDFKTIDKNLPGMNGGILLFPNTPTIRILMKDSIQHIESDRATNKPMPACLDQPYLNYHFIKGGYYDVSLMTKYALIYFHNPPPPPSEPTTVALCHFVWPLGNAFHKLDRMRKHVTHLLNNYSAIYPSEQVIDKHSLINTIYTWGTGQIEFKEEDMLSTTWNKGVYRPISQSCVEVSWNGFHHSLFINPNRESGLSIRKGDCLIVSHTLKPPTNTDFMNDEIPHRSKKEGNLDVDQITGNDDWKYISIGGWCGTAYALAETGKTQESYPFDWTTSTAEGIVECLRNEFVNFFPKPIVQDKRITQYKAFRGPHISFYHHDISEPTIQETFQRRINRFMRILQTAKQICFVRFCIISDYKSELEAMKELVEVIKEKAPSLQFKIFFIIHEQTKTEFHSQIGEQIYVFKAKTHNVSALTSELKDMFTTILDLTKTGNKLEPSQQPITNPSNSLYLINEIPKFKETIQPGKYLAYACVFYNKDYTELLRLLIASTKFYSSLDGITFLVLTNKEIEPQIQELAKSYQFPIITKTFDYTTIFQAACARLSIFDYEGIDSYEKILYLDTDIIVKGNLKTMFELPLEDKLYGLESGFTDSINFGSQFFNPSRKTSGINSGTLLFPNSLIIQNLFERIRSHVEVYTKSGSTPPYALDQPFINYHAIKDNIYDNQTLKPHVALFEDGTPDNESTAIVCHFSFPIGNFAHKFYRMKKYFDRILIEVTSSNDKIVRGLRVEEQSSSTVTALNETSNELVGRTYSWNTGFIKFNSTNLETTWGPGTYKYLEKDRILVSWNGFSHVLHLSPNKNEFLCIRLHDFLLLYGFLIDRPQFDTSISTPLCEIMGKHGSDKGSKDITKSRHNYTTLYYQLLKDRQQSIKRVFELGIGTTDTSIPANMGINGKPGASLRGWAEFFPNAQVFGADIDKRILFTEERINTFYCDQLNPIVIKGMWLNKELVEGFDLILDDGLHRYDANICFLENSIHKLNPGGIYIIEDININSLKTFNQKLGEFKKLYPNLQFDLIQLPSIMNQYDNNVLVITKQKQVKILTVILSCLKHKHLWPSISKRLHENTIILCGGAEKTKIDGNILYLECDDTYNGLSEKMKKTYEFILNSELFIDFTHILKADDHDTYFELQQIKEIEINHRHILNTQDYVGQNLIVTKHNTIGITNPVRGPFVPFLGGGETYILSKKSLNIINSDKILYKKYFGCEDIMIATILNTHGIKPYQLDLKIKTWIG